MARSSSESLSPTRDRNRDKKSKAKDKHKHSDSQKHDSRGDRDREKDRRDREKRDAEKERERERVREKERPRDREREKETDRHRDRDRSRERSSSKRDVGGSSRSSRRSRSRSPGGDESRHSKRRKDTVAAEAPPKAPVLTPEAIKAAAEQKRKDDELAAVTAEMEQRRKRVEEWRLKKLQAEGGDAAAGTAPAAEAVAAEAEVQQSLPSVGAAAPSSPSAVAVAVKAEAAAAVGTEEGGGGGKGWSLEDEGSEEEDGPLSEAAAGQQAMEDGGDGGSGQARKPPPPCSSRARSDGDESDDPPDDVKREQADGEDDDIDPLDAFMLDNTSTLDTKKPLKPSSSKSSAPSPALPTSSAPAPAPAKPALKAGPAPMMIHSNKRGPGANKWGPSAVAVTGGGGFGIQRRGGFGISMLATSASPVPSPAPVLLPTSVSSAELDPLDAFMASSVLPLTQQQPSAAAVTAAVRGGHVKLETAVGGGSGDGSSVPAVKTEPGLDSADVKPEGNSGGSSSAGQPPAGSAKVESDQEQSAAGQGSASEAAAAASAAAQQQQQDAKAAAAKALKARLAKVKRARQKKKRGSSDESSSEEVDSEEAVAEEDDAEWARQVTAGKASKAERFSAVDHSKIVYPAFRKNFYIEVPELSRLSDADALAMRKEMDGIKVRGTDIPNPVRSWTQAGLSSKVHETLKRAGFERPLPIQAQALPIIMSGRDCIGIAKTGSGKTLAFVLPLMRHVKDQPPIASGDGPIALIMAPTRELVQQISKEVKTFARPLGLINIAVFGGSGVANQISELKRGCEIVACTPGRMIDLLVTSAGKITNLRRVTYLVLDEADRMFDMGFEPQIMRIVQNIRPDRQTVLFSATFPRSVEAVARKVLINPLEIQVGGRSVVNSDITQYVELRPEDERFLRLLEVLGEFYEKGKILIFVDKQEKCDNLFRDLLKYGYPCLSLHGGKDQSDRECTVSDFKGAVCNILVATSVAARGLDVKDLVLVLNFDTPNHHEDYVHRVGRTGRAGNKGTAITFISEEEDRYAPDLVKALKESNAPIPQDLQTLADGFREKVKAGLVQHHGSGYGGTGFKFNDTEDDAFRQLRKAKAKELRGVDDTHDAPSSDSDDGAVIRRAGTSAAAASLGNGAIVAVGDAAASAAANALATAVQQAAMAASSNPVIAAAQALAAKLTAQAAAGLAPSAAAALQSHYGVPTTFNGLPMPGSGASRAAALAAAWSGIAGAQKLDAGKTPGYEAELEINDFPQHARWKALRLNFAARALYHPRLTAATGWRSPTRMRWPTSTSSRGAAVTTRGTFVAPGKAAPEGERKIYLLIEGPTELVVKRAKQEIKRILEETTEKVLRRDPGGGGGGKYSVM
ncbi:MAG: hypothetical protein WDW36_004533 [Sanguina aurantia]